MEYPVSVDKISVKPGMAHDELGVRHEVASTKTLDVASQRVMEKAGLDYIKGEEECDVEYASPGRSESGDAERRPLSRGNGWPRHQRRGQPVTYYSPLVGLHAKPGTPPSGPANLTI